MTVATAASGRKKAQKVLKDVGEKFIANFMSTNVNAISLRSKEPGICWKSGGVVNFAAIAEFAGPNSMESGSPTLHRLRVNFRSPPAVAYHLRSPAVRHKLGLHNDPPVAIDPSLELTAMPDEIERFGTWLVSWLDGHFYQRTIPPTPPIPLIAWGWDDAGKDCRPDLTSLGATWREHEYLWTPRALESFEAWLHSQ